jgi:hypothetical protein
MATNRLASTTPGAPRRLRPAEPQPSSQFVRNLQWHSQPSAIAKGSRKILNEKA